MTKIAPADLALKPFDLLDREWALLASGAAKPNLMTVSWGGFGTIWNRPAATVYVRPSRYTFELLEAHPEFTLNFLPEGRREPYDICGSNSGREGDKWALSGLRPTPSSLVKVPRVEGAELTLECRVIATMGVDPSRFLDPSIEELYPVKDYHRAYIGEVLAVWAAGRFAP